MSETNRTTLNSYELHFQDYIHKTPQVVFGGFKNWIDLATQDLSQSCEIVEIGSAFGRDARYLIEKGFQVQCTDATEAFVQDLRGRGFDVHSFNLLTDSFSKAYDLIIANAVLLHFTRDEMASALSKCLGALRSNGRFAFSLKGGMGEAWSTEKLNAPRFFCYWEQANIERLLETTGFNRWQINEDASSEDNPEWLYVVAHKS